MVSTYKAIIMIIIAALIEETNLLEEQISLADEHTKSASDSELLKKYW